MRNLAILTICYITATLAWTSQVCAQEKKIIGINNLKPITAVDINFNSEFENTMNAIGAISMGCTGTHIGNNVVVTAGHCFKKVTCEETTVKWGYRKDTKSHLVSQCKEILAYRKDKEVDFAFFTVDVAPVTSAKISHKKRVKIGTEITIYSHPAGRAMEWSGVCTLESNSNLDGTSNHQFTHQCDTEQGSSGAPIFHQESLQIIGIHSGGIQPWNYGTFIANIPMQDILDGTYVNPNPEDPKGISGIWRATVEGVEGYTDYAIFQDKTNLNLRPIKYPNREFIATLSLGEDFSTRGSYCIEEFCYIEEFSGKLLETKDKIDAIHILKTFECVEPLSEYNCTETGISEKPSLLQLIKRH